MTLLERLQRIENALAAKYPHTQLHTVCLRYAEGRLYGFNILVTDQPTRPLEHCSQYALEAIATDLPELMRWLATAPSYGECLASTEKALGIGEEP